MLVDVVLVVLVLVDVDVDVDVDAATGTMAALAAWAAALATLWDDPAAHRRYEAAALAHAARPAIEPDALLDRFIAAVEGHLAAVGGPPPRR